MAEVSEAQGTGVFTVAEGLALGLTPASTTGSGGGGGIVLWGLVIVSSAGGYLFVLPQFSLLFGGAGDCPSPLPMV